MVWAARCLDPFDDEQHQMRDTYGMVNAVLCTLFFAMFIGYAYRRYVAFNLA